MQFFIMPVPILDNNMEVFAYLLQYQSRDFWLTKYHNTDFFDGSIPSPSVEIVSTMGLDAFTNGLPLFLPITNISLFTDLENQLKAPADKIVFLLDKSINPDNMHVEKIKRFQALGYKFAVKGIEKNLGSYISVLKLVDYLLIDYENVTPKILNVLKDKFPKIVTVSIDVHTTKDFDRLRYSTRYFEGTFYRLPVTKGQNTISPLKVNSLQLLNIIQDENFEIEEIAKIVQRDVSLTLSLLKLINSPHLGLETKIKTIKQAAALLGQKELRKWVTTAVSQSLGADRPSEITKLSLNRAKFAENLATCFEMGMHSQSLFLMGLFSVIDVVLQLDIASCFDIVNVSDDIKDALVHKKGKFYPVYEFLLQYEQADWAGVTRILILNNIPHESVIGAYMNATKWYSDLIHMSDDLVDEGENINLVGSNA